MKRILLALTMVGFLLPLAPRAQADAEVSLDFFYDNLSSQGNWIEVADYGYAFQPNVAVSNSDWRPYADGYWAYTDAGWTWVSYEDFGWATYHYGRWANLDSYGWVWVPGYEWGPAWVSWRTGGDYVGWAPLPPQGGNVVYEGRAITGAVDVTFGIGPLFYNFVDIRYIGEPVLRGRLIERSRNVTIINNTVNVTNITYNNTTVFNNGPDLNRVNQFSTRPIQRLTLQRETTVSGDVAGRRGNLNRVNGNTLVVAAPAVQRSQQKMAPKQVKAKVDQPKFEKGWQGVNNRQQVEQAMQKENAQNVPPPTFQPQQGRKAEAGAGNEPNANAGNAGQAGDADNTGSAGKAGRGQKGDQLAQPNANANGNAEQAAGQENQQTAREQKRQQAEQQRAGRARKAQEPEAQPAQQEQSQDDQQGRRAEARKAPQDQQNQPPAEKARDTENRTPEAEAPQPDRVQQRAERAKEPQRAGRAPRAEQPQEFPRANRAEQAQQTQESQRPERAQPNQEARRPQQTQRPERAQRPPESHRPAQARPSEQQNNPNPAEERKGKKKKPSEEPSPQP